MLLQSRKAYDKSVKIWERALAPFPGKRVDSHERGTFRDHRRDKATGKVFRRELPIDYFENANFLRLSGENLDGSLSQLVFYTPRGIQRVKDITGKGPDEDRCGGHGHSHE